MPPLNLGVHLSLGRDPRAALYEAAQQSAGCAQIFASSPGAWKPPMMNSQRTADIVQARLDVGIDTLFIHAIYLINLASADSLLLSRSTASLVATLEAASRLQAAGVVTHIGSHGGRGYAEVVVQIADALGKILAATPDDVDLVLENSAGAGGTIGSRLTELGDLINRADRHPRLKVALDTAHLCASGWDFTDPDAAPRLVTEIDGEVGLERLVLLHANDSSAPCGSRRDRHAIVGEGHLGRDGFRHLLRQTELRSVPWILETPDLDVHRKEGERFISLHLLRELADSINPREAAHAS